MTAGPSPIPIVAPIASRGARMVAGDHRHAYARGMARRDRLPHARRVADRRIACSAEQPQVVELDRAVARPRTVERGEDQHPAAERRLAVDLRGGVRRRRVAGSAAALSPARP